MSFQPPSVVLDVNDHKAFKMRLFPIEEIYLDLKAGKFMTFTSHPLAQVLNFEIEGKILRLKQNEYDEFSLEADGKMLMTFGEKEEGGRKKAKITALCLRKTKFLKNTCLNTLEDLKELEALNVQCIEGDNLIGCGQLQRAFFPKLKHIIIPFEERTHPRELSSYFLRGTPELREFYAPLFEEYLSVLQAHPNKEDILVQNTFLRAVNQGQQR